MPPPVERGVVKPPNEGEWKSDRRNNGYLPLTGAPKGTGDEPNLSKFMHGDPGGSSGLVRSAPAIPSTPNDGQFRDGDKGLSADAPTAVASMPGRGAVPVNPFLVSGGLVPATGAARQENAKGFGGK